MDEFRRMLDGGRCVMVGERWMSGDSTQEEREAESRAYRRRMEKNRRQREYAERVRRERRVEAAIAAMSPWRQAKLFGRTATTTMVDGLSRKVDYGRAYCPCHDIPLPVPGDFLVDLAADILGFARGRMLSLAAAAAKPADAGDADLFAHGPLPTDPDGRTAVERDNRLRAERRKCVRRATCAACPTATDIRVCWEFRRDRENGVLILGAKLRDLAAYVDNSLKFRGPEHQGRGAGDGNGGAVRRPKIRGRRPGIRGWLRENCPELVDKYKTLMRYKSMADRLCQALDLPDPVPLSDVLEGDADAAEIWANGVHVQPRQTRGDVAVPARFDWERHDWELDANDRLFRRDARYSRPLPLDHGFTNFARILERARAEVKPILAGKPADNPAEVPERTRFAGGQGRFIIGVCLKRVENALKRKELWWRNAA